MLPTELHRARPVRVMCGHHMSCIKSKTQARGRRACARGARGNSSKEATGAPPWRWGRWGSVLGLRVEPEGVLVERTASSLSVEFGQQLGFSARATSRRNWPGAVVDAQAVRRVADAARVHVLGHVGSEPSAGLSP